MKKIAVIFVMLLAPLVNSYADGQMNHMWDRANTAYINGDYNKAIVLYDSIIGAGYSSPKIYYNLGNAHFKEGRVGKAVLNYNIAQRMSPSDADIKHNLAIAQTYVKDRIEKVPEFFLSRWIRSWRMSISGNAWTILSLITLTLSLFAFMTYMLSRKLAIRKLGFYTSLVCTLLFIFSTCFAWGARKQALNPDSAVVMSTAAPVKSSPDSNSKDIFVLHEGTVVKVTASLENWYEIMIDDGNKGWMRSSSLEFIK